MKMTLSSCVVKVETVVFIAVVVVVVVECQSSMTLIEIFYFLTSLMCDLHNDEKYPWKRKKEHVGHHGSFK